MSSKPKIVVSRCLGFDNCRYDGDIVHSEVVDELRGRVKFITVCPEEDIGMGTPRAPINIILKDGERRLIQPNTGIDYTEKMRGFVSNFLYTNEDVDGFILKSRSPSCGIENTKIYSDMGGVVVGRGAGFFGMEVLEHFPEKPIETEERLSNDKISGDLFEKIIG